MHLSGPIDYEWAFLVKYYNMLDYIILWLELTMPHLVSNKHTVYVPRPSPLVSLLVQWIFGEEIEVPISILYICTSMPRVNYTSSGILIHSCRVPQVEPGRWNTKISNKIYMLTS